MEFVTLPGRMEPLVTCPRCAKRLHLLGVNPAASTPDLPGEQLVEVVCHPCEFRGLIPKSQLAAMPRRVCTHDQFAPRPPAPTKES